MGGGSIICRLELLFGDLGGNILARFWPKASPRWCRAEAELMDVLLCRTAPSSWGLLPGGWRDNTLLPFLPLSSGFFHHLPKTEGPCPLVARKEPGALQPHWEASRSQPRCWRGAGCPSPGMSILPQHTVPLHSYGHPSPSSHPQRLAWGEAVNPSPPHHDPLPAAPKCRAAASAPPVPRPTSGSAAGGVKGGSPDPQIPPASLK